MVWRYVQSYSLAVLVIFLLFHSEIQYRLIFWMAEEAQSSYNVHSLLSDSCFQWVPLVLNTVTSYTYIALLSDRLQRAISRAFQSYSDRQHMGNNLVIWSLSHSVAKRKQADILLSAQQHDPDVLLVCHKWLSVFAHIIVKTVSDLLFNLYCQGII